MTYTPRPVWLDCAHPGCPRGTFADPRHLSNLLASGGHYCHTHDRDYFAAQAAETYATREGGQ